MSFASECRVAGARLRPGTGDVACLVFGVTRTGIRSGHAAGSGVGLDAETRNGPVTLEVPDDYNAQLETGTINGPMSSDVPRTVRSIGRRSHIDATLGAGGTKLRVVARNGPFSLKRS